MNNLLRLTKIFEGCALILVFSYSIASAQDWSPQFLKEIEEVDSQFYEDIMVDWLSEKRFLDFFEGHTDTKWSGKEEQLYPGARRCGERPQCGGTCIYRYSSGTGYIRDEVRTCVTFHRSTGSPLCHCAGKFNNSIRKDL